MADSRGPAMTRPRKRERSAYHHGNLREALIDAGLAILAEKGLDALTFRACAAKAGVSHAAPTHHFGNRDGLLSALTTVAFRRFFDTIATEQKTGAQTPQARLRAAGRGYVLFATANPDLFRLMFSAKRLDWSDPDLSSAARAAYDQLGSTVRPFQQTDDRAENDRLRILVWSTVHGYCHLLLEGYLGACDGTDDALRDLPDLAALMPETARSS